MADTYTTTSHRSYGSKLGDSISGVFVGIVLFLLSFVVLFKNEGCAVRRAKTLAEGEKAVLPVRADTVDPANNGKLVHFTGHTVCSGVMADPVFPVAITNELRLVREVEMYQWTESSKTEKRQKLGGGEDTVTTYTYKKSWEKIPIDSSRFAKSDGHENPGSFPYENTYVNARSVTVGAFTIPSSVACDIGEGTPLPIPGTNAPAGMLKEQCGYYLPVEPRAVIGEPQVGDVRISFEHVLPTDASFVAKQIDKSIGSYLTKHGPLLLVENGTVDANGMFHSARRENEINTWWWRMAGFILMLVGLNMILRPLSALASVLPILGTIVSVGAGIISLVIALICSLVTIALAWLFYRPLVGIPLLVVAIALAVVLGRKLKGAKELSHESK